MAPPAYIDRRRVYDVHNTRERAQGLGAYLSRLNSAITFFSQRNDPDFVAELRRASEAAGLLPVGGEPLTTSYFDGLRVHVGSAQPWMKAKPLQIVLTKEDEEQPEELWRLVLRRC